MASKEQIPVRSDESRDEALRRIRERWKDLPETTPEEIDRWLKEGRPCARRAQKVDMDMLPC